MRRRGVGLWAREDIRSRERHAAFRRACGRAAGPLDFIVRRVSCVAAHTQWYYFYDAARDAVFRPDGAPDDPAQAPHALAYARAARAE
jgi:hypothetical protein